ncbi:hypothetical protein [Nocardia brasiliensis]|uniref:hypothetical protein n=1 Tax=Nocardia brasiliensis TaxID=37326 RepID=UPI0024547AC6|nr:hypothetical protein [Nocardia brasiliensis]
MNHNDHRKIPPLPPWWGHDNDNDSTPGSFTKTLITAVTVTALITIIVMLVILAL